MPTLRRLEESPQPLRQGLSIVHEGLVVDVLHLDSAGVDHPEFSEQRNPWFLSRNIHVSDPLKGRFFLWVVRLAGKSRPFDLGQTLPELREGPGRFGGASPKTTEATLLVRSAEPANRWIEQSKPLRFWDSDSDDRAPDPPKKHALFVSHPFGVAGIHAGSEQPNSDMEPFFNTQTSLTRSDIHIVRKCNN